MWVTRSLSTVHRNKNNEDHDDDGKGLTSSGPPGLWLAVSTKAPKAFSDSGPRRRITADAAGVERRPCCPIHTRRTLIPGSNKRSGATNTEAKFGPVPMGERRKRGLWRNPPFTWHHQDRRQQAPGDLETGVHVPEHTDDDNRASSLRERDSAINFDSRLCSWNASIASQLRGKYAIHVKRRNQPSDEGS